MRYFTMAWWGGNQDTDVADPNASYAAHLAAIRDRLPPDLLATEESVSLHDCRLREFRLGTADLSLALILESYSGDGRMTLSYGGVQRVASFSDPTIGLGGPGGYGDLGYCEVDVFPDGTFEHRLLFSTGIELVIVFRDFRLLTGETAYKH